MVNDKPSWDESPKWAKALGVADFDCDYKGEWCWLKTTETKYFINIEPRPKKTNFNDWFLSLPEGRQKVLIEDKWLLAEAAFEAGKNL